jgi:ribosomal protein S6
VWGRRRLAYEIDRKTEGVYHLVTFDSDPATLEEISRVLRITDGVMRHMPLRRIERSTQPRDVPVAEEPAVEAAVGTPE